MTPQQLLAIMPRAKPQIAAFFSPLVAAMAEFDIGTVARQQPFLAQIAHESAELTRCEENLNYGAEGLLKTWPSHFASLQVAETYARQPERIANRVYANRMGNGSEASGDGWRYRGAGLIQLTGKENQLAAALFFDVELATVGDWLRGPAGACRSAAWFWKVHGCNALADKGDFDGISDVINLGRKTAKEGDALGYADRLAYMKRAEAVLP